MTLMLEWPGRCGACRQPIDDWAEAGLSGRRWIHKACFAELARAARDRGVELAALRPPTARGGQLELPMLVFLLMFHFGLGGAVAGWIMLTQNGSETTAAVLLAVGILAPLIGVAGVAVNIVSRRRVELIRRALELQGGWRPGR